jgi:hypothetical protein
MNLKRFLCATAGVASIVAVATGSQTACTKTQAATAVTTVQPIEQCASIIVTDALAGKTFEQIVADAATGGCTTDLIQIISILLDGDGGASGTPAAAEARRLRVAMRIADAG